MKKIIILGSTGSIGTRTLEVVSYLEDWQVIGLTANTNIDLLEEQAHKYHPKYLVLMNESLAKELEYRMDSYAIKVLSGIKGLEYLAGQVEADLVINSLVGGVGLRPTMAALNSGNRLGLANKESLVIGGEIISTYLKNNQSQVLPIDSEHNAIFQILEGHQKKEIKNIILTASGGPFRRLPIEKMSQVTIKEALNHPNWDMGGKVTIDSATMMNKGLEVIEAHWLFGQPYNKIKVIIHPESIIHSMVEFMDNSIMAELGVADMRLPIQYVLTYPERLPGKVKSLDLFKLKELHFEEPDLVRFPALRLAYEAGKAGGTFPVVLNAANEIAVNGFLSKQISFTDITQIIEKVMDMHQNIDNPTLEDIYQIDEWARRKAEEVMDYVVNYN